MCDTVVAQLAHVPLSTLVCKPESAHPAECQNCAVQVDEVCDTIVAQLARFAAALAPGPKGAAALGESGKACMALEAMFAVANRWVA